MNGVCFLYILVIYSYQMQSATVRLVPNAFATEELIDTIHHPGVASHVRRVCMVQYVVLCIECSFEAELHYSAVYCLRLSFAFSCVV